MEFWFSYPEANGPDVGFLDPGPMADVARQVEAAGFTGFSLTEHPVPGARWLANGGHQTLDPFVALGFVAAATSSVRLLTHLAVAPYRNPFLLAKATATVDLLSEGRMVLGIGVGYHKTEFFALGVDFEERNALFDEALDVLPLHWKSEPFSYQGLHFEARDVLARPKPVQDPIPIWIGGNARLSRRRAAERAQGWMPMPGGAELSTTARTPSITDDEALAAMVGEVQDRAAELGRPPVDICWTYSDRTIHDMGEAERHRERFGQLEAAGVTCMLVTSSHRHPSATADFVAGFGEAYL